MLRSVPFSAFLLVIAFGPYSLIAQAETEDVRPLGCIEIDIKAPGIDLEPWDAWQSWCDISALEGPVECFFFNEFKDEMIKDREFDAALVLSRLKAGERLCPNIGIGGPLPPLIRD